MISLETSVLLTLAYCDQFEWPLSLKELKERLIINSNFEIENSDLFSFSLLGFKFLETDIKKILKLLNKEGLIIRHDDFFCLRGSEQSFASRKLREKYSQFKWHEVDEFVKLISWLPWVRAVFVTGSLAVNAAKKNDDIDFLIVTSSNRLWLTRPILVLLTLIKGKGRLRKFHADNTWCLNMWLEEDSLALPHNLHSIYTAYEVCQAKCVFDKSDVEGQFFLKNSWVKLLIPNFYQKHIENSKTETLKTKQILNNNLLNSKIDISILFRISNLVFHFLNAVAFSVQYLYMRRFRMSKEKVGLKRALFHPRDTRSIITKNWKRSLNNLISKSQYPISSL